jgi:hypothetical protein
MSEGAFRVDISHLKRYRRGVTFCTLRGTVARVLQMSKGASVLQMSEDAIVGETTSVAKTEGSPPHTQFCQYRVCHVGAITSGDAYLSMQSYPSDVVDAVVGVLSCRLAVVLSAGGCPSWWIMSCGGGNVLKRCR